jgi:pimeloyl-ACP methyl ester carboxylesterase
MMSIRHDIRRQYVDTAGGQIHFAAQGDGKPMLLLGETPRGWRFFEPLMPYLAPHYRAIAVDLPGLGESRPLPQPASIDAIAGCLVAMLDALELDSVDVFGMHTGNKVAAALAAGWPERVGRLVLAGQSHSLHPDMDVRNGALAPSFSRYRSDLARPDEAASLRAWLGAKLALDETWWKGDAAQGDETAIHIAEAKAVDFLMGWRSAVPIYEAVFAFDLAAVVGRIHAQTLVLELMAPTEADQHGQGERLAALIPHATTMSVRVDHLAGMDRQTAAIADAILTFLQGTQS